MFCIKIYCDGSRASVVLTCAVVQLLHDHLHEMFSVVYTPTEGEAIQNYSRLFRRPEGVFLNINDMDFVKRDLAQWGRPEDIDYIVVTGTKQWFF